MNGRPDLLTEQDALVKERAELQRLCLQEWPIMSVQVARARNNRLLAIRNRLATIERQLRARASRSRR